MTSQLVTDRNVTQKIQMMLLRSSRLEQHVILLSDNREPIFFSNYLEPS